MNVAIGELASTGTTADTAITITNTAGVALAGHLDFFLKVVSGTVKIGIGSIPTTAQGWTSSDVVLPVTCYNGKLHLKQAANGDTWTLSAA
jgi:hypothetical protein